MRWESHTCHVSEFRKADSCQSCRIKIDVRIAGSGKCTGVGRGSLQNIFSNCICSGVRMILGDGFMVMSSS